MSSGPFPTPGGFVHPLLRARDWQDRPEFQALCQWWKDGGFGVCALVGIGGAGKTAIVERFLQVLPGGYPEHPKVSKDRDLPAPTRLFVFSFYKANPDTFFAELATWLEGYPSASRGEDRDGVTRLPSYHQVLEFLTTVEKCLLVLDGLEKVQDDGLRGGVFGQILDGRLRDFILRVADGWLPELSLVITSRFRLYDPQAARTWYYLQIPIEKLQTSAAVKLLRDRGVRGTDEKLRGVAEEQGFHALSVDLVGGYIARFCDGNPQRFSSLPLEETEQADVFDSALDPQIAVLREQERKFAQLAEQYYQVLAKSDPAALALLQRVCLFRLGVEAKTLASVFTGKEKTNISGQALARLNKLQLKTKLRLLVEMRLLEAFKSQVSAQEAEIYTVHPAVRDGFLKKLDAETARLGHDAVRERLMASLGSQPDGYPSDPATLDLLEEIVYHTLAAGHALEAFGIHRSHIGGYKNLGWRLGAYERGERICRAFAASQPVRISSPSVGLFEAEQSIIANERGLYLKDLGQLAAAAQCFELCKEMITRHENWLSASIVNQNLAEVLLLAGNLTAGSLSSEDALRFAKLRDTVDESRDAYAILGHALSLRGETKSSLLRFVTALEIHHQAYGERDRPLYSRQGIEHALLLYRLGQYENAIRMTEANKVIQKGRFGPQGHDLAGCNLLLADLARERKDLSLARELLHEAFEWAVERDAKEPLCWSALIQVKIELSAFSDQQSMNQTETRASLARAATALKQGLRIARDCGYGIYHIDLLLTEAQLALYEGRATAAERDVHLALNEGVHPATESGFPELLAATDPECLYAWGIGEGRHLLAEALLLQAAQKLGQAEFVPKRLDRLPADIRGLIDRAREELGQALELWRKLKDPESDADINPRGERTKRVLEELDGGILTEYPLEPLRSAEPTASPETPEAEKRTKPVPKKKHVFLSYCRDNRADVATLHDDLIAAGEAVWWDQDILPGQDWKLEIRKAMRNAYAVVLCLSEETADRITSGIYPEVLDAIAAYREYAPGSVFLIPVRLSDCEIPLIEIDATRTLDRLQFVDLFPPAQRATGLGRLLRALQAAPHHP